MISRVTITVFSCLALVITASPASRADAQVTNIVRWDQAGSTGVDWAVVNAAALADIIPNNYFTPKVNFLDLMAVAGSTVNLKWHVTDASGAALANSPVTLTLNPAYSYGTATLSTPSLDPKKNYSDNSGRDPAATDNANIPLMTDAKGDVTYQLVNSNTDAQGEIRPPSKTVVPVGFVSTQLFLYVGSFNSLNARRDSKVQNTQDIDILEIHWIKAPAKGDVVITPPDKATLRYDAKNSTGVAWTTTDVGALADIVGHSYFTPKVGFIDAFALTGSTVKLSWKVTKKDGSPLPNALVTLVLNPAYFQGTGILTTPSGLPAASGGSFDGKEIALKTDANGAVSYTLINGNTKEQGEVPPADKVAPPLGKVATQAILFAGTYSDYSQRLASDVQHIQDTDIIEIHWVQSLPNSVSTSGSGISPSSGIAPSGNGPVNTSAPAIVGPAKAGVTLSATIGKWKNNAKAKSAFQWLSCTSKLAAADEIPASCSPLSGAISAKYKVPTTAKGTYLAVAVTLTTAGGSTTKVSATTSKLV